MPRIICAARPITKNCWRSRNGATTPPRFSRHTKARSIRSRPSCLAAGRPSSKKPSARSASSASRAGHYPDDDEARPFWELVQELDVPVMIHPPHLGFGEERMKEYRLASSIGRPFDLCLALGRLIVRGILEDFPRVKIVASNGGGGICETISRMDYASELQDEAFFLGSYAPMKIKHPPSHYLKRMYLDTVTYNPPAVRMVLDWMGPDRVVYGSDAPPLTSLKPRAIKLIKDLDLPAVEREAIFWGNAARLLKLRSHPPGPAERRLGRWRSRASGGNRLPAPARARVDERATHP